jgi:type III secretory pathway component EscR
VHIFRRKPLKKALRDIVMATKPSKSDLADSVQIALDAADTATGVTEEFNSIKEQFEVVNIQAKRIHQSVTIIFVSAIAAAVISLAAGFLMYYKSLGTLQTNSNMAIESIAIFTENVSSLDESIKTVETNTKNQESIKETLAELRGAADKASQDIINADTRYNQAIKMSVQDTERLIQDFAENTLNDLKAQSDASQIALSEQILEIQKFFAPKTEQEDGAEAGVEPEDTLVTVKQFQALEKKVDELIMLQKEIATNVLEMNRVRKAQAKKKVSAPKPQPKPKPNPLKFP